jgi:hypothetical protein
MVLKAFTVAKSSGDHGRRDDHDHGRRDDGRRHGSRHGSGSGSWGH